jgi:hypothetical protein
VSAKHLILDGEVYDKPLDLEQLPCQTNPVVWLPCRGYDRVCVSSPAPTLLCRPSGPHNARHLAKGAKPMRQLPWVLGTLQMFHDGCSSPQKERKVKSYQTSSKSFLHLFLLAGCYWLFSDAKSSQWQFQPCKVWDLRSQSCSYVIDCNSWILTRIWRDQLERSLRRFASDHLLGSQWRRGVEVLISPGSHGTGAVTAGSLWPVEGHISGCLKLRDTPKWSILIWKMNSMMIKHDQPWNLGASILLTIPQANVFTLRTDTPLEDYML